MRRRGSNTPRDSTKRDFRPALSLARLAARVATASPEPLLGELHESRSLVKHNIHGRRWIFRRRRFNHHVKLAIVVEVPDLH
jgi:hypothetical protein